MLRETQPIGLPIRRLASGVVKRIREDEQFRAVLKTELPQEDTIAQLKREGLTFNFLGVEVEDESDLSLMLSQSTQVLYLPRSMAFCEAFNDQEEDELYQRYGRAPIQPDERRHVQIIMAGLKKFRGVDWVIPSAVMLGRILLNHHRTRGGWLLQNEAVWTTDKLVPNRHQEPRNLVAGFLNEDRLPVSYLPSEFMGDKAGVFIVGLPKGVAILRHQLHLI